MPNYLLRRSKMDDCDIGEYRALSFVVYAYLYNDEQKDLFRTIVNRRKENQNMKMCDFCCWLTSRGIKYELAFKYVTSKGLMWNIKKYLNFFRLKARLSS